MTLAGGAPVMPQPWILWQPATPMPVLTHSERLPLLTLLTSVSALPFTGPHAHAHCTGLPVFLCPLLDVTE